jgi:hypothetical protein
MEFLKMVTQKQIDRQKMKTINSFWFWEINKRKLEELQSKYKKENEEYHKKKQERALKRKKQ